MRLRVGRARVSFASVLGLLMGLALAGVWVQGQKAATASSSQAAAANQTAGAATPTASPAQQPAKVWTNDDLSGLPGESVSSVGSGVANRKTTAKPLQPASKARTAYYQNKIARLRAQIPPIDSQISQLQSAIAGTSPDTPRKYIGVKLDDWQSELAELQKKRADLVSQINSVEDQARHEGVPTNALPSMDDAGR